MHKRERSSIDQLAVTLRGQRARTCSPRMREYDGHVPVDRLHTRWVFAFGSEAVA